jgi:hypothetical protein
MRTYEWHACCASAPAFCARVHDGPTADAVVEIASSIDQHPLRGINRLGFANGASAAGCLAVMIMITTTTMVVMLMTVAMMMMMMMMKTMLMMTVMMMVMMMTTTMMMTMMLMMVAMVAMKKTLLLPKSGTRGLLAKKTSHRRAGQVAQALLLVPIPVRAILAINQPPNQRVDGRNE